METSSEKIARRLRNGEDPAVVAVETVTEKIARRLRNGEDPAAIAADRGCTTARIYNVARKCHIDLPKKKPGPRPVTESVTIGRLHAQVGQDLFYFRNIINNLSYAEAAEKLGMSVTNVIAAESGMYDFGLSELQRIAQTMGVPLADLLTEKVTKFAPMKT